MSEEEKQNQNNFILCPNCNGEGRICSLCGKKGVGLWLDGHFIFWNRKISKATILQNKLYKIIQNIINTLLFLISAGGIISLGWKVGNVFQPGFDLVSSWSFIFDADIFMLMFWVGMLAGLYLFYRFNRDAEKQEKIKNKKHKFSKDFLPLIAPASWNEIEKLNKKQKIDIAGSFSPQVSNAIEKSYLLTLKLKNENIEPIHLFSVILNDNSIKIVMGRLGIPIEFLRESVLIAMSKLPSGAKKEFSLNFNKALLEAYNFAYLQGKRRVETVDVFLGIMKHDKTVENIMYNFKADFEMVKNVVLWVGFSDVFYSNYKKIVKASKFKPSGDLDRAMTALATPFLDMVGRNLTTMAKYGYLFPCINRENEIDEIFRIMESGGRKNVILVGDQGVGKTTIIEGIAQRMAAEEVPNFLKDKRLMSLNIAGLIGGTSPDIAQARLIRVLDEVSQSKNIVLVIEDIREITGISVGEQQSLDLAGILAKYVIGENIFALATATSVDYVQHIEKNSALSGVFQKVEIKEVDKNNAIPIVEAHAGSIENKNRVYFSYEAIDRAVELSERFIQDRNLPEKAISVLEDTAVMVKNSRGKNNIITGKDVGEIISQMSNVPASEIQEEEMEKLLHLEEKIHEKVIGQDEAVNMVANALRRARAELRSIKRPIASMLFLGPTGVGKTQLAKTVAEVYFGSESNMIRLDMSEFQEVSSINRLIGSAGGGDGLLTEPVRQNPFSLILLDEIEKADKNIINIFLQVMEDGRLTDGAGKVIDFTNTIIIATSNAGTDFIQEQIKAGVGVPEITKQLVDVYLKSYYRPEFLNRLDGVIVFKPLEMEEVKKITVLLLDEVASSLEDRGVKLEVTDEAIAEFAELGFDPSMGARPLRRVISDKLRDPLAKFILENRLERRDIVVFDIGGKIEIKKPQD